MYISTCIYIYIYTYIHLCIHIHVCTYVCVDVRVHMYAWIYYDYTTSNTLYITMCFDSTIFFSQLPSRLIRASHCLPHFIEHNMCASVLQCVAVCCSVLQCVAVCFFIFIEHNMCASITVVLHCMARCIFLTLSLSFLLSLSLSLWLWLWLFFLAL